jgi:hypothetical protein
MLLDLKVAVLLPGAASSALFHARSSRQDRFVVKVEL